MRYVMASVLLFVVLWNVICCMLHGSISYTCNACLTAAEAHQFDVFFADLVEGCGDQLETITCAISQSIYFGDKETAILFMKAMHTLAIRHFTQSALHALSAVQSAQAYDNLLMIDMQETIYESLAAADHISLGSGTNKSNQAFSIHALTGDYRRIVHKPEALHWKVLEYSDPDEPLALSELERLSGVKEPAALQGM